MAEGLEKVPAEHTAFFFLGAGVDVSHILQPHWQKKKNVCFIAAIMQIT